MLVFLSNCSNIIRSNIAVGFEFLNTKRGRGSKTQPWNSNDIDQEALKDRLRRCLARINNMYCSDCLRKGPMWASVTFGVFLCFDCSDFHRNLSGMNVYHTVSVIKSINLDDWTLSQVEYFEKMGNDHGKNYYECSLPPDFIRPTHINRKEMKKFIYDKYILLRYIPATGINQIQFLSQHSNQQGSQITPSNSLTSSFSEDIYVSERSGGELCHEVDKFIKLIGENRKVIEKETIGPLYSTQQELEKSKKMKRQFELEDQRKHDQKIRGMIAMHEISTRKKQMNEVNNQKIKERIEEENIIRTETKQLKYEEKSQKLYEIENRRIEKKKEMKLKNQQFEFNPYHNPFFDYSRKKIFHNPQPESIIYPPVPKISLTNPFSQEIQRKSQYLYKLDKKGLQYSTSSIS